MLPEHAPPGFWLPRGDPALPIDGVEFESAVPTRFFQTVDAYPPEWGRLSWRIQVNKIESGRAVVPVFRTFYPGIEWNLNRPDYRWFLTAWFTWDGPGPQYPPLNAAPPNDAPLNDAPLNGTPLIEDDTVLFRIGWMPRVNAAAEPDPERPIFLRSRVDARDRRRIAEDLQSHQAPEPKSGSGVISLDDIITA